MHKWKGERDIVGTSLTGTKIHEEDSWGNFCKNIWGTIFEQV